MLTLRFRMGPNLIASKKLRPVGPSDHPDRWSRWSGSDGGARGSRRGGLGPRRGVGRVILRTHRAERALQHSADANRAGADVKGDRLLFRRGLRPRRAAALAQIVEPSRATIAFGPQFGIGDVARDRP